VASGQWTETPWRWYKPCRFSTPTYLLVYYPKWVSCGNVFWCLLRSLCIVIIRRCHWSTFEVRITKMLFTTLMKEVAFPTNICSQELIFNILPARGIPCWINLSVQAFCLCMLLYICNTKHTMPFLCLLFSFHLNSLIQDKYVVWLNFAVKLIHIHIFQFF
jgi:hypothetical protein